MISYYRCTEVSQELLFEAFHSGFSDYMIKFNLTKEMFFYRFFGAEGNALQHSFIAVDDNKGIGLILGGIKEYEGCKTLRCGALAVHPSYRRKKIGDHLFGMHKEEGSIHDCKQLFLEVIQGNDKAIAFYSKLGYEKVYDLSYFSMENLSNLAKYSLSGTDMKKIGIHEFEAIAGQSRDIHINWQNDLDYLKAAKDVVYYGAYVEERLIGSLAFQANGKVSYLRVEQDYRRRGLASALLKRACDENNIRKISLSFPNNSLLYGFVKHSGFTKDPVTQYEMYYIL